LGTSLFSGALENNSTQSFSIAKYISKRLQGAVVNSELKFAIEKDCVELFSNAPEKREVPKLPSKPQAQQHQHQYVKPEIQD
jgi:hypothetical protein